MEMGARDTALLKTAGHARKVVDLSAWCTKDSAARRVRLMLEQLEELGKLPLDEQWSCSQVNRYKGFGDCAARTVFQLTSELNAKIAELVEYYDIRDFQ